MRTRRLQGGNARNTKENAKKRPGNHAGERYDAGPGEGQRGRSLCPDELGKGAIAGAERRFLSGQLGAFDLLCCFRLRRMTAKISAPQNTKKTADTMNTLSQPTVKTIVSASAVTMPPPMNGS